MVATDKYQVAPNYQLSTDKGRILKKPGNSLDYCAEILKQSMGARNRVGRGLSYRPARLHRMAESYPSNRFLGSLKV